MEGTRRKVALLDWDNTLHAGWTLDPWVRFLVDRGQAPPRLAVDGERLLLDYLEGRLDGHDDLTHRANSLYAAATAGWRTADVATLADSFLHEVDRPLVFGFVPALLGWLLEHDIQPVVITGAPMELVTGYIEPSGGRVMGLTLAQSDGLYTGAVNHNPGLGHEKARVVAELVGEGCDVVLAAGDSDSDRPLLEAAPRQLVMANPDLARAFPGTSLLVEPRSTSGDDLRRALDELSGG